MTAPGQTAKFPTTTVTAAQLGKPLVNFNRFTLDGAINASVTAVVVAETIPTDTPQAGWLTCESEVMVYTAWATKTFTVVRGGTVEQGQNTTAASHATGTRLGIFITAAVLNQLLSEIIALETQFVQGASIASATGGGVLTPGTDGGYAHITGTTTITSIATLPAGRVWILEFEGALLLTHNATNLILQGAANYTTAAGDVLAFISEGSGNWRELFRRTAAAAATAVVKEISVVTRAADGTQSTTSTSYVDLNTSCQITMTTATGEKLDCILTCSGYNATAFAEMVVALALDSDAVVDGNAATQRQGATGGIYAPLVVQATFSPAAGAHTIKPKFKVDSGTGSVYSSAANGMTLRVVRRT